MTNSDPAADCDSVTLAMDLVQARAVWHAISTAVDLMDQVGDIPAEAPLFGQRDRLIAVAQRLDHEINHADPRCATVMIGSGTDTSDRICERRAGHAGLCRWTAPIDRHT